MLTLSRLRKSLSEDSSLDYSVTTLRNIMKHELGLRFKKIKPLVPQTNRLRCLLCRQQYAMTMLEVLASGKRVLDRERLPDRSEYYMSPMGLAGHVLVGSAEGTLYVLDAEAEGLEIVHYVDLKDGLFATPAVVDGALFVRTENSLWCFQGE